VTGHYARAALVAALLAVLAAPIAAPPAPAQPREPARAARRDPAAGIAARTLRNGLKIVVWPDHDIPNVTMETFYRVGSRNERPGITGISHFFEHMMFNGSEKYGPGEFDRVMEANGGANNAYTSEDVTAYQNWFGRDALELIFRLEADRICCLRFDSTSVESERGVIYSERQATTDDNAQSALDEQVRAAAFTAHPYGIPIIGWPSDIQAWSLQDLKQHFRTYYAPNNATMVVVGDVTPQEVFALAERYLEPIPSQAPPTPVRTREPPQQGERRVELRRESQVPFLEFGYHCGRADDPEAEALSLLVSMLVDGESSRLYRRMVDTDRVAVSVDGYVNSGFDPGMVQFFVTASPERGPAAAESSFVDELARFAEEGPSAAELAKARNIKLAGYYRTLETNEGRAEALGTYEVFRGDYRKLFTAPDRYGRVTREQVRDLARRIFAGKNRTVGVVVPEAAVAKPAPPGGKAAKGGAR
jgi:zinc protease